ncbi:MAG: thioredoxin domain-containing protein, partial [Planctomycetota bacterium]
MTRALIIGLIALLSMSCATCTREKGVEMDLNDEGGGPVSVKENRLAQEKSPYLLQHAGNPVDWYPWGEEAFSKAREEDKPIFLSIGYSTCHWCHVMAHESFEDPEVARLLNEAFVNIKVDREERPDIDAHYMSVCQMMTGSGGWPLTIIMTPEKKAFFAGTYFPRETRAGRVGMIDLVARIRTVWKERRDEAHTIADQILEEVRRDARSVPGESLGSGVLQKAFGQFEARYDRHRGGFGRSPKFPTPHNLLFLLRYWKRTGEPEALAMVEETLRAMRRGGIHDHVGFGFHRYSTDAKWLVPHFEKMLYDQALLAMAYTEAYQASGKAEFAETAHEIFTYVLRDMLSPEGAVYSAEDADSEGEEGKFYVWSREEFLSILGGETGRRMNSVFGVEKEGNFAEEASGRRTGQNILHYPKPLDRIASELGVSVSKLSEEIEEARKGLFRARKKRIHPLKDTKILTDWNGLMIAALAKGAAAMDRPEYAHAARRAADFILERLRKQDGTLVHRYRNGHAGLPAHADDYAFMIWGLVELYQATFEPQYLREAMALNAKLLDQFWDHESGALYLTAEGPLELHVRRKEIYDGAVPSANSVSMYNLLRLSRLTGDTALQEKALAIGRAFSPRVASLPLGHTMLLMGVDFFEGEGVDVVVAGNSAKEDGRVMIRALRETYSPTLLLLFKETGKKGEDLAELAPYTAAHVAVDGKATAYVC